MWSLLLPDSPHAKNALTLVLIIGCIYRGVVGEENVCPIQRLRPVVEVYGEDWREQWNCEEVFPTFSCDLLRDGNNDINDIYTPVVEEECCPGWFSDKEGDCTTKCPSGLYGHECRFRCDCERSREDPNNCNNVDGSCDCPAGWTGRGCDQRCDNGFFGPNCQNQSHVCENGGTTHPETGECLCAHGFIGKFCDEKCNTCMLECRTCLIGSSDRCDTVLGSCICETGWRGRYCTEPCPRGFYGQFCDINCSCGNNSTCALDNGICICADGYTGELCREKCTEGTYGPGCVLRCDCPSGKCNHVTGECEECPYGFSGGRCLNPCKEGNWGRHCSELCKCGREESCDSLSGTCYTDESVTPTDTGTAQSSIILIEDESVTPTDTGTAQSSIILITLIIVVAAFLVLLTVAVLFFCIHSREKSANEEKDSTEDLKALSAGMPKMDKTPVKKDPNFDDSTNKSKQDSTRVYHEIPELKRYEKAPALPSPPPGSDRYPYVEPPQYERIAPKPEYFINNNKSDLYLELDVP